MAAIIVKLEVLLRERPAGWWEGLCAKIPEITTMTGTPQPPEFHAEGDVAVHTRLAIEACPVEAEPDLCWIALLHDIGKPATTTLNDDGRITAYGHAKLGAAMAAEILARLGMPGDRTERITWVIRHHTFHHSWQLSRPADLTSRQRRTLTDPRFPLLLAFLRIDALASLGNPGRMEAYDFYRRLWEQTIE